MFSYFAYGLTVNSEFSIPEFIETKNPAFDVAIQSVLPTRIEVDFPRQNPYYYFEEGNTFLKISSIGIFAIQQGREIRIACEDGLDPSQLHLYLTGNIFAFLLLQRGYLVLHASAACVDGKAAAFLGMPGAGKSSMAAALHQIGHTILVDDVTAVDLRDDPVRVIPAFPQIKLDMEAASSMGIDLNTLTVLDDEEEKRGFRFTERFLSSNQPLSKIYILADQGDQIFQRISPQAAVVELIRNSYPTRFAQAGGANHFLQCTQLAKQVPVFRLKKPSNLKDLTEFAALLADHISSSRS
jgi:hypothetical protein